MFTKTVVARDTDYARGWGDIGDELDQLIRVAVEAHGTPDEIHFTSSQTTSSGAQNHSLSALLVWK